MMQTIKIAATLLLFVLSTVSSRADVSTQRYNSGTDDELVKTTTTSRFTSGQTLFGIVFTPSYYGSQMCLMVVGDKIPTGLNVPKITFKLSNGVKLLFSAETKDGIGYTMSLDYLQAALRHNLNTPINNIACENMVALSNFDVVQIDFEGGQSYAIQSSYHTSEIMKELFDAGLAAMTNKSKMELYYERYLNPQKFYKKSAAEIEKNKQEAKMKAERAAKQKAQREAQIKQQEAQLVELMKKPFAKIDPEQLAKSDFISAIDFCQKSVPYAYKLRTGYQAILSYSELGGLSILGRSIDDVSIIFDDKHFHWNYAVCFKNQSEANEFAKKCVDVISKNGFKFDQPTAWRNSVSWFVAPQGGYSYSVEVTTTSKKPRVSISTHRDTQRYIDTKVCDDVLQMVESPFGWSNFKIGSDIDAIINEMNVQYIFPVKKISGTKSSIDVSTSLPMQVIYHNTYSNYKNDKYATGNCLGMRSATYSHDLQSGEYEYTATLRLCDYNKERWSAEFYQTKYLNKFTKQYFNDMVKSLKSRGVAISKRKPGTDKSKTIKECWVVGDVTLSLIEKYADKILFIEVSKNCHQ